MFVHQPQSYFFISFLSVWKLGKGGGRKRECMLERHKERGMFAGLCNCADLIGGERKTISLSRSSELGNRKGEEGKGGTLDREREEVLDEGERESKRMKKSKTVCSSRCVFATVHAQGV